ncbi:MAG: aspartate--tRNA(Asn) ligase [Patescibacteria group bacterium]
MSNHPRVLIKDLSQNFEKTVCIKGFVDSLRDQKKFVFLILRDGNGQAQIFCDKDGKFDEILEKITPESTLEITGKVVKNESVKLNGLELIPEEIKILSLAATPLPIDAATNLNDRLDWRFLDLRRAENLLIFKLQTLAEKAMRDFWQERGFIEIHSPKLMGAASESGAELFEVKYFDGKAYLAQSPQFYKQMAMAAGFDKVFEIGPVFRANPSFTSRHDTEFTSIDVEIAWIDSVEDVMKLEEEWLNYIFSRIKEGLGEEIKALFNIDIEVPSLPFPRLKMKEAREIVTKSGHKIGPDYEGELDPEGEKIVAEHVKKELNHDFVFVTDYPAAIRAFYHMRDEDNKTTLSFDLLYKGLEVTTGAQREHRLDVLTRQAEEKGISPAAVQFYLDFFKFGMPPHGGFGFGLTRLIMLMLNLKNVREVTYIYRGPNRLFP